MTTLAHPPGLNHKAASNLRRLLSLQVLHDWDEYQFIEIFRSRENDACVRPST